MDLFFVLSGCVMAMLMARESHSGAFLGRRLIRVVPLYALTTLLFYLAFICVPSVRRPGLSVDWGEIVQSLLFVPYENARGETFPFLMVGWTLNFEMAFYFCCTVAILVDRKRASAWAALLASGVFAAASLSQHGPVGRFFADPIIFEFVAGLLIWEVWTRTRASLASASHLIGWLALFSLLALPFAERTLSGHLSPGVESYGRPVSLLPFSAIVVYAALALESNIGPRSPLWLAVGVRVGDASYAIYLTHMFVLGIVGKLAPALLGHGLTWPPVAIGSVVLATVVGVVVHERVDAPLQRILRRRMSPALPAR